MKGILLTSKECPPCEDLKKILEEEIASGEVQVKSIEENESEVMALIEKYKVNIGHLLIVSDSGELLAATETP